MEIHEATLQDEREHLNKWAVALARTWVKACEVEGKPITWAGPIPTNSWGQAYVRGVSHYVRARHQLAVKLGEAA